MINRGRDGTVNAGAVSDVRCTTTPGRGGVGRTSGAPAGVVPEVAITPGTATRPVARGGDAPRAARPQGQPEVGAPRDFFGKAEPKTAKSLTQQAKVSQKTTKNHKNGHFFLFGLTSG